MRSTDAACTPPSASFRPAAAASPPRYRRRRRRACSRNVCPPQHGRYSINLKGWIEHWGHQLTLIPAMWPAKHPKRFLKVIAETANAPTGIDWKAAAKHHVTYPQANSRAHPEPEEELPPEMVRAFNEKHYGPDVKRLCKMIKNHGAVRVVGIGELGNGLVRGSPNLKLIGELDSYGMVDASPFGAEEIEAHLYKYMREDPRERAMRLGTESVNASIFGGPQRLPRYI